VHAAALATLADWPSVDAAPELLKLARSLSLTEEKAQCLRSYLRWAADSDVPAKQRLTMCKDATTLAQQSQEKKLLLAALGGINSPEAVAQILPFVSESATREEACVAVVNIAERMARGRNATKLASSIITALDQVAQTTSNADLAKRAKTLVAGNK
jgi:HEAT repeat protein